MADIKENPKEAVELSQEELAAKRDEITKYYTDHIPHLQAQLDYENLLRDIEKTRAERMQAQAFMAKMAADPPEAGKPGMPKAPAPPTKAPVPPVATKAPETKKRTLKKIEDNG
jgi:hypothetical protein